MPLNGATRWALCIENCANYGANKARDQIAFERPMEREKETLFRSIKCERVPLLSSFSFAVARATRPPRLIREHKTNPRPANRPCQIAACCRRPSASDYSNVQRVRQFANATTHTRSSAATIQLVRVIHFRATNKGIQLIKIHHHTKFPKQIKYYNLYKYQLDLLKNRKHIKKYITWIN